VGGRKGRFRGDSRPWRDTESEGFVYMSRK
jgi:hypothetical protein